ncbi:MAG: aminoacyl-tRNA hydrolase [Actinobacteria bacterium]|nr:aminoacyl-tRNA hydrolase [Actinomycetota bacterium]MCL6105259.1 aminoacyl-tRNA hydrolase [Actinomycetota bacterium]
MLGKIDIDFLVVGLGNPGLQYERTRHNLGAIVVNNFSKQHEVRLRLNRSLKARLGVLRFSKQHTALAIPQTWMNDSGVAVKKLVDRFHLRDDLHRLVVIHDDLDLDLGQLKIKAGGGLAGHNGLSSISDWLDSRDFLRIRVGIGRPQGAVVQYVLSPPTKAELSLFEAGVAQATQATETLLSEGLIAAMNRYNSKS